MNTIDVICCVVLGVSALAGLIRGLTREVLGISAWAGAVFIAYIGAPYVEGHLDPFITKKAFVAPISLGISFVLSLIVLSLLSRSIAQSIRFSPLSGLDRTLGLGFGVLRACVLLCLAYTTLGFFVSEKRYPELFANSRLEGVLAYGSNQIELYFPIFGTLKKSSASKESAGNLPLSAAERSSESGQEIPNLEKDLRSRLSAPFHSSSESSQKETSHSYPRQSETSPLDKVVQTLSQLKAHGDPSPKEKKVKYDISQRYNMDRLVQSQQSSPEPSSEASST